MALRNKQQEKGKSQEESRIMVHNETFRKLALSFPKAIEQSHFEKTSFRVEKKIFATLDEKNSLVALKLSRIDRSVFVDLSRGGGQYIL